MVHHPIHMMILSLKVYPNLDVLFMKPDKFYPFKNFPVPLGDASRIGSTNSFQVLPGMAIVTPASNLVEESVQRVMGWSNYRTSNQKISNQNLFGGFHQLPIFILKLLSRMNTQMNINTVFKLNSNKLWHLFWNIYYQLFFLYFNNYSMNSKDNWQTQPNLT